MMMNAILDIITRNLSNLLKANPLLLGMIRSARLSWKKGGIKQIRHYLESGHLIRRQKISALLKKNDPKALQVGGGPHSIIEAGWINGDIISGDIYLNAANVLPFPDNSLDYIFTEQFLEHLAPMQAFGFLKESYRVLKPKGWIRHTTPDLRKLVLVYQGANPEIDTASVVTRHLNNHRRSADYVFWNGCQFINDFCRMWGHQFIYDEETLGDLLKDAGFGVFRLSTFGESDIDMFRRRERHADVHWMKTAFQMTIEAQKQPAFTKQENKS